MSRPFSSDWKRRPLGEIATIARSIIQPELITSGTLYVGLEHIRGDGTFSGVQPVIAGALASSKFRFSDEHLLYGKLRPYLSKIVRPNFPGVCSTDILPILPSPIVDRGYLYHYLRLPEMVDMATARSAGANLPRLSPSVLAEFSILLPPLVEQQRIAAMLDKADALRQMRAVATGKLDILFQSIFQQMFGDPAINPMGWPMVTPEEVKATEKNAIAIGPFGSDLLSTDCRDEGVPLIFVRNIRENRYSGQGMRFVSPNKARELASHSVVSDDILMTKMGDPPGDVSVYPKNTDAGIITADCIKLTPDTSVSVAEYLLEAFRTEFVQSQVKRATRGAAQQKINLSIFKALCFPLPPIDEQRIFANAVEQIKSVQSRQQTAQRETDTLFRSLQAAAFAGEI